MQDMKDARLWVKVDQFYVSSILIYFEATHLALTNNSLLTQKKHNTQVSNTVSDLPEVSWLKWKAVGYSLFGGRIASIL